MLSTFPGLDDLVITVVTPAETPSLAATILVLMPPVPSDEPALETSDSQWHENIREKDMILTISLEGSNVLNHFNGFGIWVASRILVVQAVNICHQEQHVCMNHGGSDGRESIVVAKLDLGNSESVILVDNGNDTLLQECMEGVLSIEISSPL